MKFNTEIKQELRDYQLPKIIEQAMRFTPLMIVANRIFPKIKEELRLNEIAYLEDLRQNNSKEKRQDNSKVQKSRDEKDFLQKRSFF